MKTSMKIIGYLFVILSSCMLLVACGEDEKISVIDFSQRDKNVTPAEKKNIKAIRFAIGGMITPREGYVYYRQLLDYLESAIKMPVELVDREDYGEINGLLESGELDFAFVCGGPYVDGHEKFGLELLVAPKVFGEAVYYSYIIVNSESDIKSLSQLEGKTFAFTDPLSNSGKMVPTYILGQMNKTPDNYFKEYVYTYAHDKSIKAVAGKMVDGAAVDSLIWEYMNRSGSPYTKKTRIIKKSRPYGIPPVVTRKNIPKNIKDSIKQAFLDMHNTEKGRNILNHMMIEEFIEVDNAEYDSIREISKWIDSCEINQEQ